MTTAVRTLVVALVALLLTVVPASANQELKDNSMGKFPAWIEAKVGKVEVFHFVCRQRTSIMALQMAGMAGDKNGGDLSTFRMMVQQKISMGECFPFTSTGLIMDIVHAFEAVNRPDKKPIWVVVAKAANPDDLDQQLYVGLEFPSPQEV